MKSNSKIDKIDGAMVPEARPPGDRCEDSCLYGQGIASLVSVVTDF